jgi:phosphate starvation-inducible protein PhoH
MREMCMKKNSAPRIYNPDNAPKTLENEPFYGYELDEEQKIFRDAIYNPQKLVVACNSKAGTGKGLVSVGTANLLYQYGFYNGIVYIISPTQEQRQGFIPGDPDAKTAPYITPLIDALIKIGVNPYTAIMNYADMTSAKNGEAYIEFVADTYLRGTNYENKVIIIDEAQNFYFDILKKTITRVHDNCKLIIIGHDKQCDLLKHPERSGFVTYLNAYKESNDPRVEICELKTNHRGWISTFADNVEFE